MTEMLHFFQPSPGQLLYHYTSAEGATAILHSNAFRLSEFSMMNDRSEYLYARSKFMEAYQNREVWVEEVPRYLANIKLNTHEPVTTMMIGCLTEDQDDIGLWDRYADQGQGCVLGIDANWLVENAGVAVRTVCYDDKYIKQFVNSGLLMLQEQYDEDPENLEELESLATMFVLDLYAFKDPRFHSEKEIRVSRLTVVDTTSPFGLIDVGGHKGDGSEVPPLEICQREGRYGPTRFIDLPLSGTNQTSAIKSVGFGPRFQAGNEKIVRDAAAQLGDVALWNSDAPLR